MHSKGQGTQIAPREILIRHKGKKIVPMKVIKRWNRCLENLWGLHPGDIHRRLDWVTSILNSYLAVAVLTAAYWRQHFTSNPSHNSPSLDLQTELAPRAIPFASCHSYTKHK